METERCASCKAVISEENGRYTHKTTGETHCAGCMIVEENLGSEGPYDPKEHGYPVQIRWVEEDGGYYFVYLPDLGISTCSAIGDSVIDALEMLYLVFRDVTDFYREKGRTLPEPFSVTKNTKELLGLGDCESCEKEICALHEGVAKAEA